MQDRRGPATVSSAASAVPTGTSYVPGRGPKKGASQETGLSKEHTPPRGFGSVMRSTVLGVSPYLRRVHSEGPIPPSFRTVLV